MVVDDLARHLRGDLAGLHAHDKSGRRSPGRDIVSVLQAAAQDLG
jgi:hypothetical protein